MTDNLPAVSLQPSNASPWRRAVSLTSAERRPSDMSLLATILDPWRCAADLLPWLAWGFSVDIWNESWPEVKKRWVIAHSIRLHRLKTTPAGIREHVALTGGEVRKIIRPPARAYYRQTMTEAERITWLDSLPQIRIRPFAIHQRAPGRWFWNGRFKRSFWGRMFVRADRGPEMHGRRASLYKDGREIPVRLEQISLPGQAPFERIRIGGTASKARGFWSVSGWGRFYWHRSDIDSRVLTLRLSDDGMLATARNGLQPLDIRPQRIAEHYTAPRAKAFFSGKAFFRRFWVRDRAPRYLYDRISLHDGSAAITGGRTVSFWGHFRFGIRPYTAEIKIAVPMRRHPRAFAFGGPWTGFWRRTDMSPLYETVAAVTVSKAFRDRILIDTAIHRPIRLSDNLRLGEFRLGELRRT